MLQIAFTSGKLFDDPHSIYRVFLLISQLGACNEDLVQAFLTSTNISKFRENNDVLKFGEDINQFWAHIQQIIPIHADRMGKAPEIIPEIYWSYPLCYMEPGDYPLHFVWWLDHPIPDGSDLDNNRFPNYMMAQFTISIPLSL